MEERSHTHSRSGGIVWPAVLIGAGGILLMQQLGYIQWSLWDIAVRLWPLLIVGIGLELLIGRRSILGSLLAFALVLGLFFGAVWMMGVGPVQASAVAIQQVDFPSSEAGSPQVNLVPASGSLKVDVLPAEGVNALEAKIRDGNWDRIRKSSAEDLRQGNYRLELSGGENILIPSIGGNDWQVLLSRKTPLSMNIQMGAGEITLHLEKLQLSSLDIKMGAGQIVVFLPETGKSQIHISLGTGQVTLRSVAGTSLSVKCTTGLGNCVLPDGGGFWERKFESADFANAANRIKIDITVGAGSSTVS